MILFHVGASTRDQWSSPASSPYALGAVMSVYLSSCSPLSTFILNVSVLLTSAVPCAPFPPLSYFPWKYPLDLLLLYSWPESWTPCPAVSHFPIIMIYIKGCTETQRAMELLPYYARDLGFDLTPGAVQYGAPLLKTTALTISLPLPLPGHGFEAISQASA